ncbi:serine-threonine/tyrosine-protein kinase catalytic domain-containing protein [Tanacetum coccineum]
MFSPDHYNYACYLVFKFKDDHVLPNDGHIFKTRYSLGGNEIRIPILKTKEETGSSKSIDGGPGMSKHNYVDSKRSWVEKRDDGWLEARLTKPLLKHHLENREELKVTLYQVGGASLNVIIVEGVEFRPVVADGSYLVVKASRKFSDVVGEPTKNAPYKQTTHYF